MVVVVHRDCQQAAEGDVVFAFVRRCTTVCAVFGANTDQDDDWFYGRLTRLL